MGGEVNGVIGVTALGMMWLQGSGDALFGIFVEIACASLNELEAHLMLAHDARLMLPRDYDHCQKSILATRKMLLALQRSVQHSLALEEARRK